MTTHVLEPGSHTAGELNDLIRQGCSCFYLADGTHILPEELTRPQTVWTGLAFTGTQALLSVKAQTKRARVKRNDSPFWAKSWSAAE